MSFTGHEDHSITLAEAADITKNFRDAHPNQPKGVFFGKDALQAIIDQPNAVGIRCYFAEKNGDLTLVLVGADAAENDLFNGDLADVGKPCPPFNSTPNPLNS
jgi:hypothetical protein